MKIITFLLFCLFLNVCSFNPKANNEMQKYGEQVSYISGNKLVFTNFSIKFVGRREVESGKSTVPYFKKAVLDFEVVSDNEKQLISWEKIISESQGKGFSEGVLFNVRGVEFFLESEKSDILKSLDEGSLVIWKTTDYENELKKRSK